MKYILTIFLFAAFASYGQKADYNDSLITIRGNVKDTSFSVGFYNLVVINKTVGKGIFGEYDGSFTITVKKKDEIGVSVVGYQTIYLSFKDSSYQELYDVELFIQTLEYVGTEVVVAINRDKKIIMFANLVKLLIVIIAISR